MLVLVPPSARGTHSARRHTPGPASRSTAGDCELGRRPATCACRHSGGDGLVPLCGMFRRGRVARPALKARRRIAEATAPDSSPDREERIATPAMLLPPYC